MIALKHSLHLSLDLKTKIEFAGARKVHGDGGCSRHLMMPSMSRQEVSVATAAAFNMLPPRKVLKDTEERDN